MGTSGIAINRRIKQTGLDFTHLGVERHVFDLDGTLAWVAAAGRRSLKGAAATTWKQAEVVEAGGRCDARQGVTLLPPCCMGLRQWG